MDIFRVALPHCEIGLVDFVAGKLNSNVEIFIYFIGFKC